MEVPKEDWSWGICEGFPGIYHSPRVRHTAMRSKKNTEGRCQIPRRTLCTRNRDLFKVKAGQHPSEQPDYPLRLYFQKHASMVYMRGQVWVWVSQPLHIQIVTYLPALANLSRVCFQNDWFVKFFALHSDAQYVCIAMEYMEWGDLGNYIDFRWGEGDATIAAHQLLCGLQYLHQNRITHRDLKPAVSAVAFECLYIVLEYSQNDFLMSRLLHRIYFQLRNRMGP